MNKTEFKQFFEPYAKNVDKADSQYFWKLSDHIIQEIIKQNIPATSNPNQVILDAGGGTGRWIIKLSKIFDHQFVLYDLSEDMLFKARKNIKEARIENKVKIIQGDLIDMSQISDESVDHVVSIYSPISFVEKRKKMVREIHRILKKGGRLIIMGHSYHNAIASKINNYAALAEELKKLEVDYLVKWAPYVPELHVFSRESMESLLKKANFRLIKSYGVPIFAQPGIEDFDPSNNKKSLISKTLEEKPEFFESVFKLEMKYNSVQELVNRGVNIFTVVEK
ncbi:hypothetical protein COZ22_00755 [bacterium (Candidatus Howlettbacteria) CG_4_10_14_3_um_filter_37_10]|nr:MAG: hypothetical protein COX25_05665 [bacterium (Candidatus Howlettbacteria) CG23_combo_of_CG06-09_8_20_14_all_37_9]PIY00229.1 MAG: hypothetical protein COZ22_00755 [bacterium (Candidatus Howlettbacteria) CG_4_10_14_3_um_filter_37_10]